MDVSKHNTYDEALDAITECQYIDHLYGCTDDCSFDDYCIKKEDNNYKIFEKKKMYNLVNY